ncbi:MAG: sigma-54 dependent transcriptional regulator [Bacteroidota bacterium]|nr:sigma-54 dependent transcriptional regulator [Bacteroidota bacterium]
MSAFKIFIVEDDIMYGEILEFNLKLNPDYEIERFTTGKEVLKNLYKNPSAISLDYSLPDMTGHEVLEKIQKSNPEIPVIVVSGQESVNTAVDMLKKGAYEYIVKDEDTKDRLWNTLNKIRENTKLKQEISDLKDEIGKKYEFNKVIKGNSPQIKNVFKLMEKAIKTNITISLTGETGTGKEIVAKAIHYNSKRSKKPFIAFNVSAVHNDLMESELFGHEKGAFTGANSRRIGKFEEASKGTIFLDEIAEMNTNMQTKLLRVIQEKELTRVGSNSVIKIDARIIVATHKNLVDEVKKGNFREDLFFRLLGLPIEIPPLRDRGNDILILAKHFIDDFCKENEMEKISILPKAQEKLMSYAFPGNVRELKAIMELSAVMSSNTSIEEDDISFNSTRSMSNFMLEENTLKIYTIKIIKHYLNKYDNNILKVAEILDIGKSTIYRMLKNNEIK